MRKVTKTKGSATFDVSYSDAVNNTSLEVNDNGSLTDVTSNTFNVSLARPDVPTGISLPFNGTSIDIYWDGDMDKTYILVAGLRASSKSGLDIDAPEDDEEYTGENSTFDWIAPFDGFTWPGDSDYDRIQLMHVGKPTIQESGTMKPGTSISSLRGWITDRYDFYIAEYNISNGEEQYSAFAKSQPFNPKIIVKGQVDDTKGEF